jgi:hypothetical protein
MPVRRDFLGVDLTQDAFRPDIIRKPGRTAKGKGCPPFAPGPEPSGALLASEDGEDPPLVRSEHSGLPVFCL